MSEYQKSLGNYQNHFAGNIAQGAADLGIHSQAMAEDMKMAKQSALKAPQRPSLERELTNLHQSVAVLDGEIDMLLACLAPISESAPPQINADGQAEILPAHLEAARAVNGRIQAMIRQVMEARGRLAL